MPLRISTITLVLALLGTARADDDLAGELPRIGSKTPAQALDAVKLHAGFRLDEVAVEPKVTDPVAACYDADGRLYVVEMRGYPYPQKVATGNVRRLEDRDGDGTFETSTIFVDGLSWPTSVVPYDGGVYIAVAPDILYAKDGDGDGVAEIQFKAFSGFGFDNVQALLNGLLWGNDGWIYGVAAANGGEIVNHRQPGSKPVSVRGRDFRFKPDGSAFEAISGGGQFGHSFDDWYHRFTCGNSNHIRQIVLPSQYLERNPALAAGAVIDDIAEDGPAAPVFRISKPEPWRIVRTRQRAADPVMSKRLPPSELVITGFFTSATGVTVYRGTAFDESYRGNAFVGDVGGNLIHRKTLEKNGAEFLARRADKGVEFLASTDNWFRPVNFSNTPDGTLLILDMYRETIEHPFSIPEPIKKHLDLTSGHDIGRIYNLVPAGFKARSKPSLSKATVAVLVETLADRDAWWRETAQRLLIERRDPATVGLLRDGLANVGSPLGLAHRLWTLDILGALTADDVRSIAGSSSADLREQAARLVADHPAMAVELGDELARLAVDSVPMVRFQAAFALGKAADGVALPALASIARSAADDRWVRAAVLSSVGGRPLAFLDTLKGSDGFLATPAGRAWLEELAVLCGAENTRADLNSLLARYAGKDAPPGQADVVALGVGRGLQRSGGSLRAYLDGGSQALADLFDGAAKVVGSEAGEADRVRAIRLLALGSVDRAVETLTPLLDGRQPTSVQLAALQGLAGLPDERVAAAVVTHWKSLSPAVRGEAIEVLFARPDRVKAMLDAVEATTIAGTDIDPARRKQLLASTDPSTRDRAVALLGKLAGSDRSKVVAEFLPALALAGDRAKGKGVFKVACSTCHRVESVGVEVGPNLATITGRSAEDLLGHILEPNREVAPQFVNYSVATADGRVLSGMIAEESAASITLKRAEGAVDAIPRAQIEEITSTGLSLMPEGLEKGLTPRDFADLIAYIRGIQGPVPVTPAR
jgi:putative membrane-bound dehydrogenase-like protein